MVKSSCLHLFIFILILSCSKPVIDPGFIEHNEGRYLFNSDEIIDVYFENNHLFLKWSGADKIKPLNLGDGTFFVKEMNEKIQFLTNPNDQKQYMVLVPKEEHENIVYNFRKLNDTEKIPSEYLKEFNYEKALEGYLAIKALDSLDVSINEGNFNRSGYELLRADDYENALNIFKINVALHPDSPNVYDSLGEAYMKKGDTVAAIDNYKKSLALDSGNRRAKDHLKKLEKKE